MAEDLPRLRSYRGLLTLAAGAVGLLLVAYVGPCAPAERAPAAPPWAGPRADRGHLEAIVSALASQEGPRPIGPRSPDQPEALAAAQALIEGELRLVGLSPKRQALTHGAANLIVRLEGRPPALVVGAHYDSAPGTPGADDNATGVAALLELARLLGSVPREHAVELVFYSLEEPPYFRTAEMGSAVHAARSTELFGMICLEMLGYYSTAPDSQKLPTPVLAARYPTRGDFLLVVGRPQDQWLVDRVYGAMAVAPELPIYAFVASASVRGVDFSDHQSYWAQGVPAVMITDTAFLRNPNYHRRGDRAATIDYARLAAAVEGLAAAVLALDRRG